MQGNFSTPWPLGKKEGQIKTGELKYVEYVKYPTMLFAWAPQRRTPYYPKK